MNHLNRANCCITFELGLVESRGMRITVESSGTQLQLERGQTQCTVPVEFPGYMTVTVNGKMPTDTKVDAEGNVVQDMYVKIIDLQINGMSVDKVWLEKAIYLKRFSDGELVNTNYLGFNGQVRIDFDKPNSFIWVASTKPRG
jgi:hypothetical protein